MNVFLGGKVGSLSDEVAKGSFWSSCTLNKGIGVDKESARSEKSVDILGCLLDVAFNIHGETRCLGYSESEVEGDSTGNTSQTEEEPPAGIKVAWVSGDIAGDLRLKR
jgi:hypothetical protein